MFRFTTVRVCRYGECARGRTNAHRLNMLRKMQPNEEKASLRG
jgi:hypothetical protein